MEYRRYDATDATGEPPAFSTFFAWRRLILRGQLSLMRGLVHEPNSCSQSEGYKCSFLKLLSAVSPVEITRFDFCGPLAKEFHLRAFGRPEWFDTFRDLGLLTTRKETLRDHTVLHEGVAASVLACRTGFGQPESRIFLSTFLDEIGDPEEVSGDRIMTRD